MGPGERPYCDRGFLKKVGLPSRRISGNRKTACSGIERVLGLWSWRGRGFQRGRGLKFAAGAFPAKTL